MSAEVFTDHAGARWPVTGYWCASCNLPMHATCVPFGTHPLCDGSPS